jgi:[histone H3]-lysine9 N-trimethyltransferase EHMT
MASSGPPPPPPPHFPITPKPDPDGPLFLPPNLPPSLMLTPELCDILQRELATSSRLLVQSQQHLHAAAASALPLPPPPQAAAGGSSSPTSSNSKKRPRPVAEMVRATNLSVADHLHFRSIVRRARLTFEALRGIYHRQFELAPTSSRNRADLRASSRMLSAGHWLHRQHRIVGHIPGVLVGDAFYYRAELCIVGLHTAPQAGIAYIPASIVSEGHPVATSIVSSGGYLDDEDTGDVLVYTGSGGRQRNHRDHHANQTLERGNLALHNSYQYGVEVRVIRSHTCDTTANCKVYVYDGLYKVVSFTFGPGKSGRDVCKFKLVRLLGQDDLGSKTWNTAKHLKDAIDAEIRPPRYISLDLSSGKESLRVPVSNNVDDDRSPLDFKYTVCPEFSFPTLVKRQRGCHCSEGCGPKLKRCKCVRKNVGGPAYNEDGTLVMGRPVVYECGSLCGCPMTCVNRVTQRGMKHRLEVFRSAETEWGVRALDLIQPGAFICEYGGDVIVTDGQSGNSSMEGCSAIDPKMFPPRWREWGDASNVDPDIKGTKFPEFSGSGYILDVSQSRSVACYISHSCTPNVFLQYVLRGNEDESCPHLMVFAMETIPPMRELSIDYGM